MILHIIYVISVLISGFVMIHLREKIIKKVEDDGFFNPNFIFKLTLIISLIPILNTFLAIASIYDFIRDRLDS